MSQADDFRQYAEEAMIVASLSRSEKEKKALIELAHIWTQTALQSEHVLFAKQQSRTSNF
jgi:hypothetical protein